MAAPKNISARKIWHHNSVIILAYTIIIIVLGNTLRKDRKYEESPPHPHLNVRWPARDTANIKNVSASLRKVSANTKKSLQT